LTQASVFELLLLLDEHQQSPDDVLKFILQTVKIDRVGRTIFQNVYLVFYDHKTILKIVVCLAHLMLVKLVKLLKG